MVPFDTALFKAPNFSVFDLSHDNKLSMGLGDLVPVNWQIVHPHERFTGEIGNLVRMQPLNGAILQNYDITFDTFFVPMRLIFGKEKSERFFNLFEAGQNGFQHGGSIPQLSWNALFYLSKPGSLLDYLGYPTYKNLRSFVSSIINSAVWNITAIVDSTDTGPDSITVNTNNQSESLMTWPVFDGPISDSVFKGKYVSAKYLGPSVFRQSVGIEYSGSLVVSYADKTYQITWDSEQIPDSYFMFLARKCGIYPLVGTSADEEAAALFLNFWEKDYSLDDFLRILSVSPEKSVEMYIDYIVDYFLSDAAPSIQRGNLISNFLQELESVGKDNAPSILPIFAYWRIISDWYMNYNLSDTDIYEIYDALMPVAMDPDYSDFFDDSSIVGVPRNYNPWYSFSEYGFTGFPSGGFRDCFKRNWANDYFTSAFRSPQSGTAVPIPQNGNIPDLRRSNVLQETLERVMYAGRRYRDQVRAFFSIVPENSRLDVCEVLSREVQPLQISEVTQTNQADLNKMLETPMGSFGGQSQTVGSHRICDYTADEHGIIMTLASIRPKAAYMQGVRRELLKTDVYDFLWPQFESIGEQEIYSSELFADFDPDETFVPDDTFGYQRRYGEFMFHQSEVHADMLNSQNYLHSARDFAHLPSLNVGFGEIRAEDDDLNRVFVYSADERPFLVELYFDTKMIRPLSRYIHYDL